MREQILRIPANVRRAIYTGPLFVLWVIGFTVETGQRELRASGRGLAALLGFVAGHTIVLLIRELVRAFIVPGYGIEMVFFVLKSLIGLAYLFVTCFLAFREYKEQEVAIAILDRAAERVDAILSK